MRRRLILATTAVTAAVLVLAGIPMVLVVQRLARSEASTVLRRQAESIATGLAEQIAAGQRVTTSDLLGLIPPGDRLVLTTPSGSRIVAGPTIDDDIIHVDVEAIGGTHLRLETSASPVNERMVSALASLAVLALAALGVSAALAALIADRATQPLGDLATSARRLGEGDFSTTSPRSGLPEFDDIADALDATARRIAQLVRAERQFSANASHQMRSALTGLRLRLEAIAAATDDPDVVEDAEAALDQADRLTATVDDLLRLARTGRYADATTFDVTELVRRHLADLQPRVDVSRRSLSFTASGRLRAVAAPGAVGQALEVLLDNALRHGTGRVAVEVAQADTFITITVCDEGTTLTDSDVDDLFTDGRLGGVHGIGLPLARTLIEADGGRLDVISSAPAAFRILVPAADDAE